MLVLFPSDPFEPWKPDPDWREEAEIAERAGHTVAYVHWESLTKDEPDPEQAVRKVPDARGREDDRTVGALYRGWMLTVDQYEMLYRALIEHRNVTLLTHPNEYAAVHELPSWYADVDQTPESRWVTREEMQAEDGSLDPAPAVALAAEMAPCVIRDFVKSRKHEWEEACFVPDADAADRVVRTFVERQGEDLQGGVVVRSYVPLRTIGKHPKSGMPMSEEYRVFWMNGHVACISEYWPADAYEREDFELPEPEGGWEEGMQRTMNVPVSLGRLPSWSDMAETVRRVGVLFFTMDIAETADEGWIVVEVGDGQVSGFPQMPSDAEKFYSNIEPLLSHEHGKATPPPLTRAELDAAVCSHENCDHSAHGGEMVVHPRCHVGKPTWCVYDDGVISVLCSECDRLVARIAVADGPSKK